MVDNADAKLTGDWSQSSSIPGYIGTEYLHDGAEGKGTKSATFVAKVPAGKIDVRLAYTANPNRATNVSVSIESSSKSVKVKLNQREAPKHAGFQSVGTLQLSSEETVKVIVSNAEADGHVIVDAVQFVPIK